MFLEFAQYLIDFSSFFLSFLIEPSVSQTMASLRPSKKNELFISPYSLNETSVRSARFSSRKGKEYLDKRREGYM